MNKTLLFILIIGMLSISLVLANEENFTEIKQLIDSKISCDNLSDKQLESIGDYYMEQMHPGEAHELMHKMMGGEDSEFVKLMHINMAKSIYCGENTMMGGGMMGMMGSGGMMNMMYGNMQSNMMDYGWNKTAKNYSYFIFLNFLYAALLIGLVILVYLGIIKLLKNMQNKGKGR